MRSGPRPPDPMVAVPLEDDARAVFCAAVWDDMLRLYGAKAMPSLCLHLQDRHGADVPLLLVLVLADHVGLGASSNQARGLIEGARFWRETVVRPLREVRRDLRDRVFTPGDQTFREAVKRLELDAERRHVERLAVAFAAMSGTDRLAPLYLSQLGLTGTVAEETLSTFSDTLGEVFGVDGQKNNAEFQ